MYEKGGNSLGMFCLERVGCAVQEILTVNNTSTWRCIVNKMKNVSERGLTTRLLRFQMPVSRQRGGRCVWNIPYDVA